MFIKHRNSNNRGFTLIELLVVVAIIGILSGIVLASLSTARTKGKITSVKANLKSMIAQAELSYDTPGNYSAVCVDPGIVKMLTSITNTGVTPACYTHNSTTYSDVYLRWGVSVIKEISSPLQAWSVSQTGVVTWDVQGITSLGVSTSPDVYMTWTTANDVCRNSGGRLPTLEEFSALSGAVYIASGGASYTPPGFLTQYYWTSTVVPSSNGANAYVINGNNILGNWTKNNQFYVRCVR